RLERGHAARIGGAARDVLLEPDGAPDDCRRQIWMAVEEFEVPLRGARTLGVVRIELPQRRLHRECEAEVLHPARVPGRLQEKRPPEDAQERDDGHARSRRSRSAHGNARSSAAAPRTRANPTAASTGPRGSRIARMAVAAARAQTACHAPFRPETNRGGHALRALASAGDKSAQAKQIDAVTANGKKRPRRLSQTAP